MIFTKDQASKALSAADRALCAADVTAVWLDMSGSGWTGTYKIIIDTEQKHGCFAPIKGGVGVGNHIWRAMLPPAAQIAVSTALAGLEVEDRVILTYEPRGYHTYGEKIWPRRHIVADLRRRIVELEAEIARLNSL